MSASGMRLGQLCVCVLAASTLAGCAGLTLPDRGFATRYFVSAAHPLDRTHLRPLSPDSCEAVARTRAGDAGVQGFDDAVQRTVYEAALKDCRYWQRQLNGGAARETH